MKFEETTLAGVWTIEIERLEDSRGWFTRTFDSGEFRARGLNPDVLQCNSSFNTRAGTIRGMHYQSEPYGESKLVRCVRGAIFDVAVDLRPESPTFCRWYGIELSAENRRASFISSGIAHGFQTVTNDCEVLYQMGQRYVPEAACGVRWDDPAFAIRWRPSAGELIISDKDRAYPDFRPRPR
jgi:dTDP-4-dehydrorhamnose 3,5-epimerase